jgi:signal transduction histidine kinase
VYDRLLERHSGDGVVRDVDVALKDLNGYMVWVRINAVAEFDSDGNFNGGFGYARDITGLKNSETELEHMKKLLEHKQKELDSMALNTKYRIQSQVSKGRKEEESILYHSRLSEIGDMVSSLAHQWRQPLSALMFIIEDVRDAYHFGELDVQYLDDAISECRSYVNFMSETMDDFRNFFKPDKEKEQYDVVQKTVEIVKMQYGRFEVGAVDVKIVCDLTESGGSLENVLLLKYGGNLSRFKEAEKFDGNVMTYGYPNLYKQVIINLLNNAIDSILKSRKEGGLESAENGLITISIISSGHKILVTVEDNGVGLADGVIDKIFEPSFTTKPNKEVTGIGLHMAKSIVEKNLGGKIKAGNSENGAIFTIELPCLSVHTN